MDRSEARWGSRWRKSGKNIPRGGVGALQRSAYTVAVALTVGGWIGVVTIHRQRLFSLPECGAGGGRGHAGYSILKLRTS